MHDDAGESAREINLRSPLTYANSYRFPLQSRASRREIVIGGLWLLVPFVGWLMNMGHRIVLVHHMHHGEPAWPAWTDGRQLLRHGLMTFSGMVFYCWPGVLLAGVGLWLGSGPVGAAGVLLFLLAVVAIPGFMSHYCRRFDPREIFDPRRALRRVFEGGLAYWKAWAILLPAMALSFVGLLAFGVGFVFTSVWFWQVAAFGFASVFTTRFALDGAAPGAGTGGEAGRVLEGGPGWKAPGTDRIPGQPWRALTKPRWRERSKRPSAQ